MSGAERIGAAAPERLTAHHVGGLVPAPSTMMDVLFSLPLWLLAAVLNVWLMGTALVGIRFARRWIIPRLGLTYEDAYYAAALVQSAPISLRAR